MRGTRWFLAVLLVGFALQWFGAWANKLVIHDNGDRMPVLMYTDDIQRSLMFDNDHTALTNYSADKWLCDVIAMPFIEDKQFGMEILSLGDVCMDFGTVLFVVLPFLPPYFLVKWIRRTLCT